MLYGGHQWSQGKEILQGLIFILDVPTMTWVQGDSVSAAFVSADSACTLTGINFISWGGMYRPFLSPAKELTPCCRLFGLADH